jgi:hypothetical protein
MKIPRSFVVGPMADQVCEPVTTTMQPGDIICLYIDGAQQSDDIAILAVRYNGPKK